MILNSYVLLELRFAMIYVKINKHYSEKCLLGLKTFTLGYKFISRNFKSVVIWVVSGAMYGVGIKHGASFAQTRGS